MTPSPEAEAVAHSMLYREIVCPGCGRKVRFRRRVGMPPQRCQDCRARRLLKQRREASSRFYYKQQAEKKKAKDKAKKKGKMNG